VHLVVRRETDVFAGLQAFVGQTETVDVVRVAGFEIQEPAVGGGVTQPTEGQGGAVRKAADPAFFRRFSPDGGVQAAPGRQRRENIIARLGIARRGLWLARQFQTDVMKAQRGGGVGVGHGRLLIKGHVDVEAAGAP